MCIMFEYDEQFLICSSRQKTNLRIISYMYECDCVIEIKMLS